MRILTKKALDKITDNAYQQGLNYGKTIGKQEAIRNDIKAQINIPIRVETIELIHPPEYEVDFSYYDRSETITYAKYRVTYRTKNSPNPYTLDMSFESADFSMADVRRKIVEEFCGGICGKEAIE